MLCTTSKHQNKWKSHVASTLCLFIICSSLLQQSYAKNGRYTPSKEAAFVSPTRNKSKIGNLFLSRKSITLPKTQQESHQRQQLLARGGGHAKTKSSSSSSSSSPTTTAMAVTTSQSSTTSSLIYDPVHVDASSCDIDYLCNDQLKSNIENGLSADDFTMRVQKYGLNQMAKAQSKSIWKLIAEQFEDRLVQILVVVAVVSGLFSLLELQQETGPLSWDVIWKTLVEPFVIVSILVINAIVGVWQSSSASSTLEALQDLQPSTCTVQRDGEWLNDHPAMNLVPGDIIQLRVGDKIPADARLLSISTSSFKVDEGSLTGESITVSKLAGNEGKTETGVPIQDQKGMLFSGTVVTSGSGIAIVTQTGTNTQFGKIQQGISDASSTIQKTPLAIKLDEFGDTLTLIIGGICLLVWIVSIPKMNDSSFASVWDGALYYAKVAVALGVAAIPEGLPAVITLCLSLGTRKMAQRNVIVRNLESVETLGCTTVICTDKTGTLTTNEMTAVSLVLLEQDINNKNDKNAMKVTEHPIDGTSYSPEGKIEGIVTNEEIQNVPQGSVADVAAVAALCNDARINGVIVSSDNTNEKHKNDKKEHNNHHHEKKEYQRFGEPTEAALCVLAEKLGGMPHADPNSFASAHVDAWRSAHSRQATLEFNRDRKSMSVLCDFSIDAISSSKKKKGKKPKTNNDAPTTTKENRLLVKGAPNLLLERCTHVKYRDGTVVKMTAGLRKQLESKITELATRPLRCLALAIKDNNHLEQSLKHYSPDDGGDISKHPLLKDPSNYKHIESGLTLVGIVGIKDPARLEVAGSIESCTTAGIRVMMITGDAKDTAVAIAKDVGIFTKDNNKKIKAFQGREFFLKPKDEQLEILKKDNIVFCRAEPADKQILVKMLQSLGEIPAMTGDGVNDAPALKQAAIGVAMGTGTEVSKEAADMVLADDNFSTIVSAVEEGRRIYANMQAFICFLISCNIGEICAIFIATLAGIPEPLSAMHLLWVNLVTDGPPATALGFNPPAPDLMTQPPRPTDEPIMTRWLLIRYCLTGLYVGIATIGVFVQHYLGQGITLDELANWSQCGAFWTPQGGNTAMCTELFQGTGRLLPQSMALTTLVCMEMLKALSAVSVDNSLLRVGPQENTWLLWGVAGPFALHLLVLYSANLGFPALGESFGIVPLSLDDWTTILYWSVPILLVDEVLKFVGRRLARNKQSLQQQKLQAEEA